MKLIHLKLQRKKSNLNREKGFTLLELLVAMALLSVIVVCIYGGLIPLVNAKDRIDEKVKTNFILSRFSDFFTSEVRSIYFKSSNIYTKVSGVNQDKDGKTMSKVTFTTNKFTVPGSQKKGDLSLVSYYSVKNKDNSISLYKSISNPFLGENSYVYKDVVLRDIKGFKVMFYDGLDWLRVWDSSIMGKTPTAIKLIVFMEGGDQDNKFILTASPHVI